MRAEIKERIELIRRGELPNGYSKSIIGIVPSSWDEIKFSEIFHVHDERTNNISKYPLYSLTIEEGVVPKTERYERGFLIQKEGDNYKIVDPFDIVYNPMNLRFGAIAQYTGEKKVCVSSYYDVFRIKNGFDNFYIDTFLRSVKLISYYNVMATGSLIEKQRVHFSQFIRFVLPMASINEQKKISEVLSHCEKVISLKQQLIEEKKKQKKWLMQNILDPDSGVRLPGFEGEWSKKRLKKLCFHILDGDWIESKDQCNKGIRLIQTGNIGVGKYNDKEKSARYIDDETFDRLGCNEVVGGDVIISRLPDPIGRACIVPTASYRMIAAVDCTIIRFNGMYSPRFFVQYACSYPYFKSIYALSAGSTRARISRQELENLYVPVPSMNEQLAIAKVLYTADEEIAFLEDELSKWVSKKKALMQLLLTGIVRVNS